LNRRITKRCTTGRVGERGVRKISQKKLKEKLKLNSGETLKQESHRSKGTMAETDIWTYSILDSNGNKVGSVVHTDHASIKGFNRTQPVEQRDSDGKVIAGL